MNCLSSVSNLYLLVFKQLVISSSNFLYWEVINEHQRCTHLVIAWRAAVFNFSSNRERGKVINKHWKIIPANTDVLITHGPPMGILDQVGSNDHAGCADLLRHVERIKPKFHIFGHIHGSHGRYSTPVTQFINASIVDDNYDVKNFPLEFRL